MGDVKGNFVKDHLSFFERNIVLLQNEITAFVNMNLKQYNQNKRLSLAFENIGAQESFEPLTDALQCMKDTENAQNEHFKNILCSRLEEQLIARLKLIQQQAIVPLKKLIADRDMVLGHYKKDKKAWGRKLVNVDALVDYHMEKIEYFRMVQFKQILQEFSKSQIYYHCQALQMLPKASKTVAALQPQDAVQEWSLKMENM